MRWTDDELDRLIRSANPSRTPESAEPEPEDWQRMRRIMTTPAPKTAGFRAVLASLRPSAHASRSARIAVRTAWAMPIIAAVAAVGLSIGPLTAAPAYAITPPPLVAEPIGQTSGQVVAASIGMLRAEPDRPAARDAEVVRWALRDDGKDDPVILPEWQSWVWNSDGTGRLEATAGAPYSVTADGRIVPPAADAPAEGTPIETTQGQTPYGYFADEPPADASALRTYLEDHVSLGSDADGLATWGAISALRDKWTLSPDQQAAAIELLAGAGDLRVLGTVTDRFGRAGIALKVPSTLRPEFAATIVLDATSREIIAADVLYLGANERLTVPAGSVIEYSAWLSR